MGRRNKIKKQKKIEEKKDIVRDNTDYSIKSEIEEKKTKFFGIFEKTKDTKIEDFSKKIEIKKKEEDEKIKRIEELKEKAKKDAENKAKQLQKEKKEIEQKIKEESKLSEEVEQKIKEESKSLEETEKKIKKGTFASLLSNIKTLDNFKEDVIDETVMMKEIIENKKKKVSENILNLKILEDNKIYTLKIEKQIYRAKFFLTNLDETEKIEFKLHKHRYQDTANYLFYNNKKIKVDRHNTIIRIEKQTDNINITGKNNTFNIKLKNKNIDCIKLDISKNNYLWI